MGLLAAAKKRYRHYSLGMKQRLAIAAGLLRPRELIILDEPTNGLDPQGTREVRALIRQIAADGTTVFVSSHLLAEVEQICTHVGVMRTGKLVFQGSLPELRRTGASRVSVQTADPEAAAKVLTGLGLADAQARPRPGRRPSSATRRRSRSAPSSSRPGSASAASRSSRPAWKTCSSGSPGRASMSAGRFYASELRLVLLRRRNLLLLAVTAVFPLIIGIALRLAAPRPEGGDGGTGLAFFNQLAGNGVFLTFIALSTLLVLVLPVVVAVVAGDSVAGEAGYGTLRYLLAVPAGRTRLLAVKYGVIVTFALCATFIVSAVALAAGAALFPVGPVTLLSGTTVSLAAGLLRLLFVTLYVTAAMAALGAIGLAISTLTEHAIGAIATLMILVVTSEVLDNVPQLHAAARTCQRTGGCPSTPCCASPWTPPPCSAACSRSRSTPSSSAPSPGPASPQPTSPADPAPGQLPHHPAPPPHPRSRSRTPPAPPSLTCTPCVIATKLQLLLNWDPCARRELNG